jgi:hypothetical protein
LDASAWWWVVALSLGLLGSFVNAIAAHRQISGKRIVVGKDSVRTTLSTLGWGLIILGYGAGIVAAVLGGISE